MARFILRLLLIGLGLGCVAQVGVVALARSPDPPTVLSYVQERDRGRSVGTYDPASGLTVHRPDRGESGNWSLAYRQWTVYHDVYISPRGTRSGTELFVVSADHSVVRQLTYFRNFPPGDYRIKNVRNNAFPQWSPDGSWIVFVSSQPASKMDVYLIRLDGSDLRRVAADLGTYMPLVRWDELPQQAFHPTPLLLIPALVLAALRHKFRWQV
jgi:hypothetical protein